MDEIEFSKEQIRKEYILIRKNIKCKKEKSKIITDKTKENLFYKNAKVVALYKSFASEVDTRELIEYTINNGKIVVLPKVVNNELRFYKINSEKDALIKSKFGVEEPVENEINFVHKNNIDLVIVPGVCFDKEKNRLGFGKGYYDRFLSNTNLKTIAICYKEQILDKRLLPVTEYDVKVQRIITDYEMLE